MNRRALLQAMQRAVKNQVRVRPNEMDVDPLLKKIGQGARKKVYADASDPANVTVDMYPHAPTEEFFRFAKRAHQQGAPYARHLPNPEEMTRGGAGVHSGDDTLRFRTERLLENDKPIRIGRENGEFYVQGLADDDPQRAMLLEAARALDGHLATRVPKGSYFYDMHRSNFMRRPDGTLVINDPVAGLLLALGVGGGASAIDEEFGS